MATARHSWEEDSDSQGELAAHPVRHAWEEDSDDEPADGPDDDPPPLYESDSEGEEVREPTPQENFVSYLQEIYLDNEIKAIQMCSIMWYGLQCGIEECRPYALRPTSQSGKFQPKLKQSDAFLK